MSKNGHLSTLVTASSPLYLKKTEYIQETRRDPKTGDNGDIQYWYEVALNLEERAYKLLDHSNKARNMAAERRAINAGLKAVVRSLLRDLEKADPKNPLLIKENRDRIFNEWSQEEEKKILKIRKDLGENAEPWEHILSDEEWHKWNP